MAAQRPHSHCLASQLWRGAGGAFFSPLSNFSTDLLAGLPAQLPGVTEPSCHRASCPLPGVGRGCGVGRWFGRPYFFKETTGDQTVALVLRGASWLEWQPSCHTASCHCLARASWPACQLAGVAAQLPQSQLPTAWCGAGLWYGAVVWSSVFL